MSNAPDQIDSHLAALPQPQREALAALRTTRRELLPDAEECISSNRPCFKVNGAAVAGFDGFTRHCSYLPHSGSVVGEIPGIPAWCTVASKGTLQFPIHRTLPKAFVKKLVGARQREIVSKQSAKQTAKRRA